MEDKHYIDLSEGLTSEQIEQKMGFTHYVEIKQFESYQKIEVYHKNLVNAFFEMHDGRPLQILAFVDGSFKEEFDMGLEEIRENLNLLEHNEGLFQYPEDDNLGYSVGLLTDTFMAEFVQGFLMFSGKEEECNRFADILDRYGIKRFPVDVIKKPTAYRKLGKNELCWCGSNIKYKKCCLKKDIEELGRVRKVPVEF